MKFKITSSLIRKGIFALLCIGLLVYLIIDYRGPEKINLKTVTFMNVPALKANEMVVQQYDSKGNLWATRGMVIYKLKNGETEFRRTAHLPTGFSLFWLRNFTIIRKLSFRPECIETIVSDSGDICAMSAGFMWYRSYRDKKFTKTLTLPNYGIGSQGIRNNGILNTNDSTIFLGEYFKNPKRTAVNIFVSRNYGKSWEVAYTFKPGEIRHIHSLQKDPFTGRLWVCTGDKDSECMVAWSADDYKTLNRVGSGDSRWRVCQLVFTEQSIYWGTDTGTDLAGIHKLNKQDLIATKLQELDGPVFYGTMLKKGTIIMSTNREGMKREKDDKTRMYMIFPNDQITSFIVGTWNIKKPDFLSNFATLRFQRDQGSHALAITIINQKEFSGGELIIISEDNLIDLSAQKALQDINEKTIGITE